MEGITIAIYQLRTTKYWDPPIDVIAVGDELKNRLLGKGAYELIGIVGYGLLDATTSSKPVYFYFGIAEFFLGGFEREGVITTDASFDDANNCEGSSYSQFELKFFLPTDGGNGQCSVSGFGKVFWESLSQIEFWRYVFQVPPLQLVPPVPKLQPVPPVPLEAVVLRNLLVLLQGLVRIGDFTNNQNDFRR